MSFWRGMTDDLKAMFICFIAVVLVFVLMAIGYILDTKF